MKLLRNILMGVILSLITLELKGQVIVKVRPVPPKHAVVVAPGPVPRGKVWIPGHWELHGKKYVWRNGYYTKARPGYRYKEGYWVKRKHGWVYKPGIWIKL